MVATCMIIVVYT